MATTASGDFAGRMSAAYMGACWRELSRRARLDVSVIAFAAASGIHLRPFNSEVICGVKCDMLSPEQRENAEYVASLVAARKPDVDCLWRVGEVLRGDGGSSGAGRVANFVLTLDTPLKESGQRIGQTVDARTLRKISAAIVAGERSANLAEYSASPRERICRECMPLMWRRWERRSPAFGQ